MNKNTEMLLPTTFSSKILSSKPLTSKSFLAKPLTSKTSLSKSNLSRAIRAFTLIEALIVLLLVAIAMAVSMPLFLSSMKDAQKKQCRANMLAIANAEQEYKIKASNHTYTTVLTNLVGDFPVVPVCPNGGVYSVTISDGTATSQSGQTVPAGDLIVTCSAAADGKLAPDFDSQ